MQFRVPSLFFLPLEKKPMLPLQRLKRLFNKACGDYALLQDGDRVLVAVSGGKDSMLLARLMAERSRLHKPAIQVEAAHVVMDNIPYAADEDYLRDYCQGFGIDLHVLHTRFDPTTDRRHTPCFLCSWYRRKALFEYAAEHGFNKVALGHHQDDILVTLLMNETFEGSFSTMSPSMPMEHYPFTLIRPLCLIPESLLAEVAEQEGIKKLTKTCPYEHVTRRTAMTDIFHQLERLNPEARFSLWRAIKNDRHE